MKASTDFFDELAAALGNTTDIRSIYRRYEHVLMRFLDEHTAESEIIFAGPFAKMDYLLKEHNAKWWMVKTANAVRVRLRKSRDLTEDELRKSYLYDLRSLCQFIAFIDGVDIPDNLLALLPKEQHKEGEEKMVARDSMRMIVSSWDDTYVYGNIDDYPEEGGSKVSYASTYPAFPSDWSYLKKMFYPGAQLNLVRPHVSQDGAILPELIIFEPDYLINVTTVARCFTHYADSAFVHLIQKIEPAPDNWSIILGNFAGQLLDEELSGNGCMSNVSQFQKRYNESVMKFFRHNALNMLTTEKADWDFHEESKRQAQHIHKAISEVLPKEVGGFNKGEGIVEPSFYSAMLGLEGRMDYLQMDFKFLLEQKAGKGAFPYNNFVTPTWATEHFVQLQLYMLLFRYNYREKFKDGNYSLTPMLLYSKYENPLVRMSMMPKTVFEAIKIRNGIAWLEMQLTKPGGYKIYDKLTPQMLNVKKVNDKLWNGYQLPQLSDVLSTIHGASPLERAYFYRFMQFISNEHVMSKLGNKTKECSGFASTWHETLSNKRLAGNIYDNLELIYPKDKTTGEITHIDLQFSGDIDNDMSNFRRGDIVILYPYNKGEEPNATRSMVMRCTIKDITKDNRVILNLRHPQSDNRIFVHEAGKVWAIEHDFMEASYDGLYRGMFSFLSAPKERRDLLLFQREPEVDKSLDIKGDYGAFNELSRRVKQAKDVFLIIGPPGTGKTSYGMLNTLKEALLEPDSSVLLMSYTNRAVDEICSKLKAAGIDFIRIGGDTAASGEYKANLISDKVANAGNLKSVKQMLAGTRVYAGTTTSISSHLNLFQLKQFDLAIIDEASQILEPHLMAILSAQYGGKSAVRKFVMIGDHKQLPAVVQQSQESSRVKDPLLNAIDLYDCRFSLFERLLRRYHDNPDVVYMLTKQGRMHPDISDFPNFTFYNGMLKPVPLPHQKVVLPNNGEGRNGIDDMLTTRRIAFIASERPVNPPSDKVNPIEAEMIAATIARIYNIEKDDFDTVETVGVIVPYRNQISAVRKAIDKYGIDVLHNISIDTVERYQGSQRRYIIYGFTVQLSYQLNFLTDNVFEDVDGTVVDRKLNVAMTRAEEHLIMIGNAELLSGDDIFEKLINFVKERQGYFEIGKNDYISGKFKVPNLG